MPRRLQAGDTRVLKQNRGNGGRGIRKVELDLPTAPGDPVVRVLHARRGSVPETLPLGAFVTRCQAYFEDDAALSSSRFRTGCRRA